MMNDGRIWRWVDENKKLIEVVYMLRYLIYATDLLFFAKENMTLPLKKTTLKDDVGDA